MTAIHEGFSWQRKVDEGASSGSYTSLQEQFTVNMKRPQQLTIVQYLNNTSSFPLGSKYLMDRDDIFFTLGKNITMMMMMINDNR